jgi:hypothetical protein
MIAMLAEFVVAATLVVHLEANTVRQGVEVLSDFQSGGWPVAVPVAAVGGAGRGGGKLPGPPRRPGYQEPLGPRKPSKSIWDDDKPDWPSVQVPTTGSPSPPSLLSLRPCTLEERAAAKLQRCTPKAPFLVTPEGWVRDRCGEWGFCPVLRRAPGLQNLQ